MTDANPLLAFAVLTTIIIALGCLAVAISDEIEDRK